ncbi:MAG: AhpC/TSA family protein [Flavobacteriaceae bacterium]|nr:AhpC/TSA family protein [Flavobacteriaceae bacterium]
MKKLITVLIIAFISMNSFSQINNEHLEVGEKAPLISGVDQFGKVINSTEILKEKKILVVFYRGNWCPYCRKHLASLQENLEDLQNKGLSVIVVTPEKVEKTIAAGKKLDATFSIVHDVDNKIMNDYKVAFDVNDQNVTGYFGFTQRKITEYNAENNNTLPVPATYLIDIDGKIVYVHYDPDHHERSDFKDIIKLL